MTPSPSTPNSPRAGARRLLLGCVAFAVGLGLAADAASARQQSDPTKPSLPYLEDALYQQARKLLEQFDDAGKEVHLGVLKFRTRRPGGRWTDNDGELNQGLADRLEVALVLAMKEHSKVRILRQASEVAAKNPRANHLTKDGRAAFFNAQRYRPAWGREAKGLKADAFVTGEAEIDLKERRFQVQLRLFERADDGAELKKVGGPFLAFADRPALTEAGVSYHAVARGSRRSLLTAARLASKDEPGRRAVVKAETLPIQFAVYYGDRVAHTVAPTEADRTEGVQEGEVLIPTPKVGQKVTFRLRRAPGDTRKLGVVVKVNGVNTIYPDEPQDQLLDCCKWILDSDAECPIDGFQISAARIREFKVVPRTEAEEEAIRYGPHEGTISVTVFRAREADDRHHRAEADSGPLVGRGAALKRENRQPLTLRSLQNELRPRYVWPWQRVPARGLIVGGDVKIRKVGEVAFDPYEDPIASFTIRYSYRRDE